MLLLLLLLLLLLFVCLEGSTQFYIFPKWNFSTGRMTVSFESVTFKDQYLVMDKEKDHIYLGFPRNHDEQFEIVIFPYSMYIALKDSRGCFMGFDRSGRQVSSCALSPSHPQTKLFLKMVKT